MAIGERKEKEITVRAEISEFDRIRDFVEEVFEKHELSELSSAENVLVLEELFVKIVEQVDNPEEEIVVSARKRITELIIEMEYYGSRFIIENRNVVRDDIGTTIINRYEEKIGCRFKRGNNTVSLRANRNYDSVFVAIVVASILAVIFSIVVEFTCSKQTANEICSVMVIMRDYFSTAMLLIAAPVTFFSFVTNITNAYVLADKRIRIKNLLLNISTSSMAGILLGLAFAWWLLPHLKQTFSTRLTIYEEAESLADRITNFVPENIFSAFTSLMPFPLLVLAILTAMAICTMNARFEEVKGLNDSINKLFCRMLSLVYCFLPLALFVSLVELGLDRGIKYLLSVAYAMILCYSGMIVMFFLNGVRLAFNGMSAWNFFRTCLPAFRENFRINSTIDAIPYNTRFCQKYLGVKMRYAESAMPITSQLNLDGNCFLLTFMFVILVGCTGYELSIGEIVLLAITIFGLSLGAPNQPGSLLIGLLILVSLIGDTSGVISLMIIVEAFVGRSLTLINNVGNLTTIVIEAQRAGELK